MKISELIEKLESYQNIIGDIEVSFNRTPNGFERYRCEIEINYDKHFNELDIDVL